MTYFEISALLVGTFVLALGYVLVIATGLSLILFGTLFVVQAIASWGGCRTCGAPANAQRHASECPWGEIR